MIYLDSAVIDEAKAAVAMGWIKGITTNPTLLNKSDLSAEECLKQLSDISPGELYYQLCATNFEAMVREGNKAAELIGNKIVLKIPATELGFRVTAHLSPDIPCSFSGNGSSLS